MTQQHFETFDLTIENDIAHICLNRPDKRNSMIPSFWEDLPNVVQDIDDGAKARVIVISSSGPVFTAGMDLNAFTPKSHPNADEAKRERIRHGAAFYDTARKTQAAFNALEACRLPVLAAIQGGCVGGGLDMVTACDMRYCTQDAFFTIFEINIGMTADVGTFPRLVQQMPEGLVRELAYTGRRMAADEAYSTGLVNRVFASHEEMLDGVMDIAAEIASKAPLAVYGCKHMINYSKDHTTADTLDYIAIWNASFLQSQEMQEAMVANAEKRSGDFVLLPSRQKSFGSH
ncbi:MAG: crotonase/enoyl-CoA hydratase family protein [Gammaproteobacteria bacterium TMED243]|nr:enoyl-CoA hydratase [Gammaproteobacteria bacterium]RPG32960.1 MAG: crotonase/enoyl-CoA hydratase family protein [Gammaproteobacteria bacterium TMED243]